jgi:hypothetical protein
MGVAKDAVAQWSPVMTRVMVCSSDTMAVDSMAVFPGSLVVVLQGDTLANVDYRMDEMRSLLSHGTWQIGDTLVLSYRTLPWKASTDFYKKDPSLIRQAGSAKIQPYVLGTSSELSFADDQGIQKNGSISRGVLFGNNQNLSVNSTLNLQLSGKVSEEVSLLASITDDNIPIQPAGNTQQLQDFDQVFIQLYNRNSKLIAGDFQLRNPSGYFMRYFKRAQGLYVSTAQGDSLTGTRFSMESSASVSKGRFARNVIQGVEGNQGPYRLTGADNELFIIVLSGTEVVYIDGRALERGMDKDYVIDYNAAEITFTPRNLITKDRRITVEFQYSERRFARPLLQANAQWKNTKTTTFVSVYTEGDAKNQPLQQTLSDEDRAILAAGGDDFLSAYRQGVDSVGYRNNEVRYAKVDSLGFDSVWVFSEDSTVALYRVNFSYVGPGNGDYVEAGFSANGRIYQWIQPVYNGVNFTKQGSYAPIILLSTPKTNQLVSAGFQTKIGRAENIRWQMEGAFSRQDLNTFSALDAADDLGWAAKSSWSLNDHVFSRDSSRVFVDSTKKVVHGLRWNYEFAHRNFKPIERFREVEFQRNWNLGTMPLNADQHIIGATWAAAGKRWGKVIIGGDALLMPDDYRGVKGTLTTAIKTKSRFTAAVNGSALQTDGNVQSVFVRHRGRLTQDVGRLRFMFIDEHERNLFRSADTIETRSYAFYDWEASVGTADSVKRSVRLFYRDRIDRKIDGSLLQGAARADQYGAQVLLRGANDSRFSMQLSNRRLRVIDPELFTQAPENTLVGRLEYTAKWWKGFVQSTTFYELGSGLEQRREFIYLEVPAGQGVYVWIDYNNNQVKELNEFEVAAFSYEANYIRTFVQSNDYVKTYSNQWSESIALQPARVVKGARRMGKFVARLSSSSTFRIDRKTSQEDGWNRFNPLLLGINDSVLLTTNALLRNVVFYNKANPKFGLDYTRQTNQTRNLLSNGFESRIDLLQQLGLRWNFIQTLTFYSEIRIGRKEAASDFLAGRNYTIVYNGVQPKLTYQPDPTLRMGLSALYNEKKNTQGTETAVVRKLAADCALNALEKGTLRAELNFYSINYAGASGNSLAFEMLEGLQPGYNFTWSIGFQKNLSEAIQLNLQYNGRKPMSTEIIHAGSMQIRAVF